MKFGIESYDFGRKSRSGIDARPLALTAEYLSGRRDQSVTQRELESWRLIMKFATKLFTATLAIAAISAATFISRAEAAPIVAPAVLKNAPGAHE